MNSDYFKKWNPDINYQQNPGMYHVGRGQQGVLICEPYKSEICAHWRFKTVPEAKWSSQKILSMFYSFLDNDDLVQLKPPKINAKDTLAAGDVWHGAFTYAVSIGTPIVNACKYANLAASKKCENLGGIKATPYKFKNDYVK